MEIAEFTGLFRSCEHNEMEATMAACGARRLKDDVHSFERGGRRETQRHLWRRRGWNPALQLRNAWLFANRDRWL